MTAAADDPTGRVDPLARFRIDGKVAVVTGASSGLGARFAEVLDGAGARLVIVARRAPRLQALAARLSDTLVVAADVTRPADVEAVASAAMERYGRVDILVNNAGTTDVVPAEEERLEEFRAVVDVNLGAAFHVCQVIGRQMLAQGEGTIINVASMLGVVSSGQIPQAGYAASKAGLINLSRELAAQWGRRGVRVNALCPGWFPTEMTSDMFADERSQAWIRRKTILGRAGREDELDGALLWLASEASSYMTGSALIVDGGFTAI
jgi:NAD(P)-dependent dehydrogenase (short-subunit alcohol dehydrogenase family)